MNKKKIAIRNVNEENMEKRKKSLLMPYYFFSPTTNSFS